MKRWLKAFVAIIALVAMLTENTYSVYATMDSGYVSQETDDTQIIEVNTEEESAPEVEVSVADDIPIEVEAVAEEENIEEVEDTGIEDTGALLASEDIEESAEAFLDYDSVSGKIIGEGLNDLHIAIDSSNLSDDTYYVLHIDTYAQVEYDGYLLEDNEIPAISNKLSEINLSNLEYLPFELYIIGENDDSIGAEYYIESVENGAIHMNVNMDGSNVSEEETSPEEEEEEYFVNVSAVLVDEFGDAIDYEEAEPEFIYDEDGIVVLDDVENPPFENFEIDLGADKIVKYSYKEAQIDGTVILALRQQEVIVDADDENIEDDAEDSDAALTESGFTYDYTVDGENWEQITEDSVVELVYSDGKKTEYTYEDGDVYVRATLQHANAIPDDAELYVTRITPETPGYNYDAYMQAVNDNAGLIDPDYEGEEERFNEDNSMLYDIAFMCEDKEGNLVEFQPADGMVKIVIDFKSNQLTDDISASESDDVLLAHLPLVDEVKDSVDSTAEATDIASNDIVVEPITSQTDVEGEEIAFSLSDFSVLFVAANKMNAGPDRTFASVLGNAVNYGVTANKVRLDSHIDSNFATKLVHDTSRDVTVGKFTGNKGGSFIISDMQNCGYLRIAGNNGTGSKIKTTKSLSTGGKLTKNNESFFEIHEKSELDSEVDSLINYVKSQSTAINNEFLSGSSTSCYNLSNVLSGKTLDIRGRGAGTFYIKADGNTLKDVIIKKREDQTIIFNYSGSDVRLERFFIENYSASNTNNIILNKQSDANNEEIEPLARTLIFNMPNAKQLNFAEGVLGTFLAPNAKVTFGSTCTGWLVCDEMINNGEWHCVYGEMPPADDPDPIRLNFSAIKKVDDQTPTNAEKFKFELLYNENWQGAKVIQTVENNGEKVTFDSVEIKDVIVANKSNNNYAYEFIIREVQTDGDGYLHDSKEYYIHYRFGYDNNKKQYYIAKTDVYTDTDNNGRSDNWVGDSLDVIKFNNHKIPTPLKHEITVKKLIEGSDGWPEGVTFDFELRPFDGGGNTSGVTYPGPMPAGSIGTGKNAVKRITLSKDNPEGSFGEITIPLDYNTGFDWYDENTKEWYKCDILMYTITEVIPEDKPVGVTYANPNVRYVKLFINKYQRNYGLTGVVVERASFDNVSCDAHDGAYEFTNKYNPARLVVKKTVVDKNNNSVATNDDFYVVVYSKNSTGVKTYYDVDGKQYSGVCPQKISANEELTFIPLPTDTQFYVEETDAAGNPVVTGRDFEYTVSYDGLNSFTKTVTLSDASKKKQVTVKNTTLEKGKVTLTKMGGSSSDEGNTVALDGVTFHLKEDDNSQGSEGTRVYVTKESDGTYKYAKSGSTEQDLVTDANGNITITDLPIGKYYLTEVSLPEKYEKGYIKYNGRINFTVKDNGTTVLTTNDSEYVKGTSKGIELALSLYNNRVPAAITIEKSLIAPNSGSVDSKFNLEGYKFYLYDVTSGKKLIDNASTDKDGKASFAGKLQYGHSYVIEEDADVAANNGTILNSLIPSRFTVDESWYDSSDSAVFVKNIGNYNYVTKKEIVNNTPVTGKIRLIKTDKDNKKISEGSAEFVLSTSSDYNNEGAYLTVNGSNGVYSFDINSVNRTLATKDGELTVDKLAPGRYYFYEVKSPNEDKYTFVSGTPYSFKIDAKGATSAVVELISDDDAVRVPNDAFNAKLSFNKVNAYDFSKKLSSDTVFTLYETETLGGSIKGDSILTAPVNDGVVNVSFAKAANYVLEETQTENGYESKYDGSNLKIYFTVSVDQVGRTDLKLSDVNAYTNQGDLVDKENNNVLNKPSHGKVTLKKQFVDTKGNETSKYIGEAKFKLYTNSDEYKASKNAYDQYVGNAEKFVKYEDSNGIDEFTTTNRELSIENLPWGRYYFVETETVKSNGIDVYTFDSEEKYYFTIGENESGELILDASKFVTSGGEVSVINNTIKTGSVRIIKKDSDNKNKPIPGVWFDLYTADDEYVNTYKTGNDGSITVDDLEFGSYYFKEKAADDQDVKGYTYNSDVKYNFTITGESEPVTTLTYDGISVKDGVIYNTPIKGNVTLEKWAVTLGTAKSADPKYIERIEGAEFELYSKNPSTTGQKILSVFSSNDKYYLYKEDGNGTYKTDSEGRISVHNLPWGQYYFIETKAPLGYVPVDEIDEADKTFNFAITEDNLDVIIGGKDSNKVALNERYFGSIKLNKIDSETKSGIPGVKFDLWESGTPYTNKLSRANTTNLEGGYLVTDEDGVIVVHDLPWGTYTFKEAVVPEGYTATVTDSETITINAENVSKETTYDFNNSFSKEVTMENTPIKGDLYLKKINEYNTPLTGASFDLVRIINKDAADETYNLVKVSGNNGNYTYDGIENKDYREGKSITERISSFLSGIFSGEAEKGSLELSTASDLLVKNLPYGDYVIYERTMPEGYEPEGNDAENKIVRFFKIDGTTENGHDAEVTFTNSKVQAGVQFVKTAGGNPVNNINFRLEVLEGEEYVPFDNGSAIATSARAHYYDVNNNDLGEYEGVVSFSDLPVGRYRIYEFSNVEKNQDAVNSYPYYNANNKPIWSMPDNDTKYYDFVITASDSNKKNVGIKTFDGNEYDNKNILIVENKERMGKAQLTKTEADQSTKISGAKFALYEGTLDNSGHPVLGNLTSDRCLDNEILADEYGFVKTDMLPWGNYYLVETQTKDATYFLEDEENRAQYHFTIGKDSNGQFTEIVTTFTVLKKGEGSTVSNVAVNKKFYGKARFEKRDSFTNKKIDADGISFDLYYKSSSNGEYKALPNYSGEKALKASGGVVETKKDLEAGLYYFVETSTAKGYKLPNSDEKYYFEIKQGKSVDDFEIVWNSMNQDENIYYVTNEPELGSIELYKYFVIDDTESPLVGAEFTLYRKGTLAFTKVTEIINPQTSDKDGLVKFENLPWGTYKVVETKPPVGYEDLDWESSEIIIDANKQQYSFNDVNSSVNLKVENKRKPGKLSIKKVDGKGDAVSGVKFELQMKQGDSWIKIANPAEEDGLFVTGEGGLLSIFNVKDKKGKITVDGLEWGWYRFVEKEVPEGYLLEENPYPSADGAYVGAENKTDESQIEYTLDNFVNNKVYGNIAIKKTDKDGKGLGGAEFALFMESRDGADKQSKKVYVKKESDGLYSYVSMDETFAQTQSDATLTLETPADGKIKVTGLPCGTYWMQETKAPNPGEDDQHKTIIYQKRSDLIGAFVVKENQEASDAEKSYNFKEVVNDSGEFKAELIFYKTDADTANPSGLNGVEYEVTNLGTNEKSTYTSQKVGELNGVVRIEFYAIGKYSIQEVSTPNDAYEVDRNPYEISIYSSDNIVGLDPSEANSKLIQLKDRITLPTDNSSKFNMSTNTFANDEAKGGVKLIKKESESGLNSSNTLSGGLNGVTFNLFKIEANGSETPIVNKGNNTYDFVTSTLADESGVIKVLDLEWGNYVFVEKVPEGYKGHDNEAGLKYPFTINEDTFKNELKIAVVTAVNNRIPGSLTLQKFFENEEDGFDGSGVEFTLTLVEGTSDVITGEFFKTETTKKDKDGNYFVKFTGLPWGVYELTEGTTKEGYIAKSGILKTIKIGNARNSSNYNNVDAKGIDILLTGDPRNGGNGILNEKIKGSLKFEKINSKTMAPMSGVQFKIYKSDGTYPEIGSTTSDGKSPIVIDDFTDANGVITTVNGKVELPDESLEYGRYYLEEAVPEGYVGYADGKFTYRGSNFEIKSAGKVDLTKNSEKAIENEPSLGEVKLSKIDNHGKPLSGVEFTLYVKDLQGEGVNIEMLINSLLANFSKDKEPGIAYRTYTTNSKGEINITGLPWGTYYFKEKVPEGYSISEDDKKKIETPFIIGEENGSVSLKYSFENIVNEEKPGSLTLSKKGHDPLTGNETGLLEGAKFNLYRVNGNIDTVPGSSTSGDAEDTLINTNGYLETSKISGDNYGKITVDNLPWGKYYFVEVEAPIGYVTPEYNGNPVILEIGNSSTENSVTVSYQPKDDFLSPSTTLVNEKGYGYAQLKKEFIKHGDNDADTRVYTLNEKGEPTYLTFEIYNVESIDENGNISGSPVEVTLEDGSTVSEWNVNEGTLMTDVIGPLPFGRYAFVEKSIPSGVHYERSNAAKTFVIDENSMDKTHAESVTFVNTDFYGYASIGKVDASTNASVDGISFDVYEVSGADDTLSIGSKVDNVETVLGTATVKNLPLGRYAFKENANSAELKGYQASENIYVFDITESLFADTVVLRPEVYAATKNADGTYALTDNTVASVENERISGSIQLVKLDDNKNALKGAKFNLYKVNESGSDQLISDKEGKTEFITDENGETEVIDGLEWGSYYFVEIESPRGYQINTSNEPVTISGLNTTGVVKVNLEDKILELDIDKVDINNGVELSGAEFAIYDLSDNELIKWESSGSPKRIKIGIDNGNEGNFEGLYAGEIYVLKELTPPEGYKKVEDTYFSVGSDNKVTLYKDAAGNAYDGNAVQLDKGSNIHKIIVKDAKTEILISKRELGTNTFLPGATLKVLDSENYEKYKADKEFAYVDSWTVPKVEGDYRKISGLNISDTYYLIETDAPKGYYKADDVEFTVNESGKVVIMNDTTAEVLDDTKLVMYDQPILVSIAKKATTGTDNLKNAVLRIFDGENVIKEFITDSKPTLLVPEEDVNEAGNKYAAEKYQGYSIVYGVKFEDGKKYTLHEKTAPDGYKKAQDKTFTISMSDGAYNKQIYIYEKDMLDEPIKLYVSKLDMTGEKEIPGAKLSIYELDGESRTLITSWTSGETPYLVSIDNKKAEDKALKCGGNYVLKEESAPLGYALTDEVYFSISEDGVISEIKDSYQDENNVAYPLVKLHDEPLALCVAKVDYRETKLPGAKLQLRDKTNKVYAEWTTTEDGLVAFISEVGETNKTGYVNVKLNSGCHLKENETYYVYEIEAPAGFKKNDNAVSVKALKYKESLEATNLYKVYNSQNTSIGGSKTWKITPELEKQLQDQGKYITINLYRYYVDSKGNKHYVKLNGEVLKDSEDKKDAIINRKNLKPVTSDSGYLFDNLDKLYRSSTGEVFEYVYETEEDLNGLDELLVSKKFEENGNVNFVNYQRYININGNKEWIMLKDENGNIIDPSNKALIDAIRALGGDAEFAYVDVDVILAVKKDNAIKPLDSDEDGKADYYFTIKRGKKDSTDVTIDASKNTSEHVVIEWNNPDIEFSFKKLPMFDEYGNEIEYVFIEKPSKSAEEGSYGFEIGTDGKLYGTDGDTISNIPVVDPINIRGDKTWIDPYDDSVQLRPSVALQLYRSLAGKAKEKVGDEVQLNSNNNYHFEFNNLPEYALSGVSKEDIGKKYTYTLEEVGAIGKYDVTVNINGEISRITNGDRVLTATVENKIKDEFIEISGTKTWNNEYNMIHPTVTFRLFAKDSTGKEHEVTSYVMGNGTGNKYSFTHLPKYDTNGEIITYRVEEDMTTLGGYKSTPEKGYTIVPREDSNDYSGNDFTNTPSLIRVAKISGDTKRNLAGAKLRVLDKDNNVVDSWTTSADVHYIEGLTFGESYTLEETDAPLGYLKASPVKFTVNADSIKSGNVLDVIMEDPKGTGSVRLTKRDAETRETLSGATFNLYTGDGSLVHVTGSSGTYTCSEDLAATTTLSVSTAGALTVDGLPFGSYYFRETSAPRGYRVSTSTEGFTLYEGGSTAEVTFLNTRLLGSAYLRKTASDGRSTLAGAVFELYSATPRTAGQAAASTIYSDAYYRYGTYTTGADGMLYVRDLPWDDYYFIEVAAPAGYVTNTDVNGDPLVYTFTVDSASSDSVVGISMGTITNDEEGGGGGGGDTTVVTGGGGGGGGVAGVRRKGGVLSDVLGVRAKPTSGVLGARVGPVTGDIANIALWLLLLIASISIIVVISIQNHKKKKDLKN